MKHGQGICHHIRHGNHYMVSGVKSGSPKRQTKGKHSKTKSCKNIISQTKQKMENQVVVNEAITKAVAEVTRAAIQAFVEMQSQRPEGQWGPKLGGPALRQPQFNWEATDKYTKWKAFILEVRNMLSTYNTHDEDKLPYERTGWAGEGCII